MWEKGRVVDDGHEWFVRVVSCRMGGRWKGWRFGVSSSRWQSKVSRHPYDVSGVEIEAEGSSAKPYVPTTTVAYLSFQ